MSLTKKICLQKKSNTSFTVDFLLSKPPRKPVTGEDEDAAAGEKEQSTSFPALASNESSDFAALNDGWFPATSLHHFGLATPRHPLSAALGSYFTGRSGPPWCLLQRAMCASQWSATGSSIADSTQHPLPQASPPLFGTFFSAATDSNRLLDRSKWPPHPHRHRHHHHHQQQQQQHQFHGDSMLSEASRSTCLVGPLSPGNQSSSQGHRWHGCNSWCCRLASRSNITQSFNYKRKRFRTAFTAAQMNRLESSFRRNRYAIGSERRLLARDLGLTETQIKVWFQNRRTKYKKIRELCVSRRIVTSSRYVNMSPSPSSAMSYSNCSGLCDVIKEDDSGSAPMSGTSVHSTFSMS